jgi:FHA domain
MADQPEKKPAEQDTSQSAKPAAEPNAAGQNQKPDAPGEASLKPSSSAPTVKASESTVPAPKPPESAAPAPKPPEPAVPAPKPVQPAQPAAPKPPESAAPAPKPAAPPDIDSPTPKPPAGITRDFGDFKDSTIPSKGTALEQSAAKKEDTQISPPPGQGKPTQRIPEPSSPGSTQSGGQICPTCGHRNRPGVLICDNCGTNLMTGSKSAVGTRDLVREQEEHKSETGGDKLLDTDQVRAIQSAGAGTFTEDMVLRIEIEGGTTPMMVYPKNEIIMGRRDPNTGGMPDVDLTSYAGYRMGVSRRHAAIRLQDSQLNVSDLGSSNGTFLNGTRLSAHRPYQVRDGDEIRLGQMVLRVYFQSSKDKK